jgi:hypothetical protein
MKTENGSSNAFSRETPVSEARNHDATAAPTASAHSSAFTAAGADVGPNSSGSKSSEDVLSADEANQDQKTIEAAPRGAEMDALVTEIVQPEEKRGLQAAGQLEEHRSASLRGSAVVGGGTTTENLGNGRQTLTTPIDNGPTRPSESKKKKKKKGKRQ